MGPMGTVNPRKIEHGLGLVLRSLILYLRGMKEKTFQLSGFYF